MSVLPDSNTVMQRYGAGSIYSLNNFTSVVFSCRYLTVYLAFPQ